MSAYARGSALVTACAAGTGAIVVVEGETERDDAFVYGRWFGDRARDVSFFPQNGWTEVVAAVTELRGALPGRTIFGIIDRDFADDAALAAQAQAMPQDGIFRTQRFTLENYLLEPEGWFGVMRVVHRGSPPAGWASAVEVAGRIEEAYRLCFGLASWNYVVHHENARFPQDALRYCGHPSALPPSPGAELSRWGRPRRAPIDLGRLFQERLDRLAATPVHEWPRWITGKAVLKAFLLAMPALRGKRIPEDVLVSLYLDKHPVPAADLREIVGRILAVHRP